MEMKQKRYFLFYLLLVFFSGALNNLSFAQAELTAWGNLSGIRVEGQLLNINTSMCLIGPSMMDITATAKEKQQPSYTRKGNKQFVTTELSKFSFSEMVQDTGNSKVKINIKVNAVADTLLTGAFLCFDLPANEYSDAKFQFIDSTASKIDTVYLFPRRMGRMPGAFRMRNLLVQASVKGFRVVTSSRKLEVRTDQSTEIIIQKGNPRFGYANDRIYLGILLGHTKEGQTAEKSFMLKASGEIDRTPVQITIDSKNPGREFDGIGGNFRIQNEKLDTAIINYCLDNLNVKWARIEMPWYSWHPVESINPLDEARSGKLAANVRNAMEMAQKLSARHIPIIISAWFPPAWSIIGESNYRNENGIFGNPLNPKKMRSIIKSIGDYFVYLKEAYGVEPRLFSFNESDLGINVRMTGQEHADFIKKLGAYLASKELGTKMLLGDNSDATSIDFIEPALQDPATHQYIGAISFHAWRGCDNWTLSNWADASRELNVPLLIGEGGTDAQAHQYPDIFNESSFAQDEIDIYIRSCNIGHVKSILQWQLTSDYSLLSGGGVYRTEGPLHPTQRFYNLKQLGTTPAGSFILPTKSDNDIISCAAFADITDGIYSIHIVNHGADRKVILEGLPQNLKKLQIYVTDKKRGMEKGELIHVSDGRAKFTIDADCFTSLISVK
jgi:hypothetical protein